jgi:predicted O-linked N-acetylglucosamine transferase (SPINDLY family)/tetratricopeptide (TPR) repeat protein
MFAFQLHAQRKGNIRIAIGLYEQALALFPQFPEAHQNVGHLYETQQDLATARWHHQQSITYASSESFNASAIVNLVLLDLKTMPIKSLLFLQPLSDLLGEADRVSPNNTNVMFTHAQVYEHMGDMRMCVEYLRRVLAIDDRHTLAWLNLGNQWFKANNFEVATKFYKNALERIPVSDTYNRVLVLNNLGQCYRERGMLDQAQQSFYAALQTLSTQGGGRANGHVAGSADDTESSRNCATTFSGGSSHGKAVHFWCINNIYTIQGLRSYWRHFELLENVIQGYITSPAERLTVGTSSAPDVASFRSEGVQLDAYTMSLLTYASRETDRHVCEVSCPTQPAFTHPSIGGSSSSADSSVGRTGGALCVGYLSHDWRDHPMGRLTATLVVGHSRSNIVLSTFSAQSEAQQMQSTGTLGPSGKINVTTISYGADDHSDVRHFVESHVGAFIDAFAVRNDMEVAQFVRSLQLDILVDITAHTYNGRIDIAALRPAPLTINYLGFPGTTGCAGFDYSMVTAAIVPPELAQSLFTERMLYLPHTYQSNDMPLRVAPPLCAQHSGTDAVRCRKRGYLVRYPWHSDVQDVAIPADVPVVPDGALLVCSFNANKKMELVSFRAWMNVLLRVPRAVLVMLDVGLDVMRQIQLQAEAAGVLRSRLVFVPKRDWSRHLRRSAECDLVLDTFVYGAHTTASDVLWMGAPLLSLAGYGSQRMPSRVAASITQALALPKAAFSGQFVPGHVLVVDTVQGYEDTAVRLLRAAPATRHALSTAITHAAARGAAFDSELIQWAIESAYQLAHEARALVESGGTARTPHLVMLDELPYALAGDARTLVLPTWERKLRRDLASCCGREEGAALLSTSTAVNKVTQCRKDLQQNIAEDRPLKCKLSELAALSRRLVSTAPGLFARLLHPEFTSLDDPAPAFGNREPAVPLLEASGPAAADVPEEHDCELYVTVSCAVGHLSHSPVSPAPECDTARFPAALEQCYMKNAPAVMDFTLDLQGLLVQAGLFIEEQRLLALLVTSALEAAPLYDLDAAEAETRLQQLTTATTFLNPLWRRIPAESLRRVIALALIPQQTQQLRGNSDAQSTYFTWLGVLQVRLFAPAQHHPGSGRNSETICAELFRQHGLAFSPTVAEAQCRSVLSRQLATLLTEHSVAAQRLANAEYAEFTLTPTGCILAAFALDPTDQRLLNLGTVLMDHNESEVGFFLSSVAALRMAKVLPLAEDVRVRLPSSDRAQVQQRGTTRVVFYCNEYGQGWWPGTSPADCTL